MGPSEHLHVHRENNTGAIGFVGRGDEERVSTVQGLPLDLTKCIECGQCAAICPTGAMRERHDLFEVGVRCMCVGPDVGMNEWVLPVDCVANQLQTRLTPQPTLIITKRRVAR